MNDNLVITVSDDITLIGYWLSRDYQGMGVMTKCVCAAQYLSGSVLGLRGLFHSQ